MNQNILIGIIIVIVVIIGGVALVSSSKNSNESGMGTTTASMTSSSTDMNNMPDMSGTATTSESTNSVTVTASTSVNVSTGSVKSFTVTGSNFKFAPAEIKVNKGDTVKITFKNAEGFHDFKIDEFKVATKQIKGGAEQTVEFVADKAGTFEYYCSVGEHRQMGMHGNLIVQ